MKFYVTILSIGVSHLSFSICRLVIEVNHCVDVVYLKNIQTEHLSHPCLILVGDVFKWHDGLTFALHSKLLWNSFVFENC